MAEDVADDHWICAAVDLSSRVAVSQQVRTEDLGLDPCTPSVLADPMANRPAGQRSVRHSVLNENLARRDAWRAAGPKVGRHGSANGRQQRQLDRDSRLGTAHPNRARRPVDILKPQAEDLGGSEAVRGHHEQHREVSFPDASVALDLAEHPANVCPGQCPDGSISESNSR